MAANWTLPNWSEAKFGTFTSPEFMQHGFRFGITMSVSDDFRPTFYFQPRMRFFEFTLGLRIVNASDPSASVTVESPIDVQLELDDIEVACDSPIPPEFSKDNELTIEITLTPGENDTSDQLNFLLEAVLSQGQLYGELPENALLWLLAVSERVFLQEPTMLRIDSPVILTGDLHGQFYEILRLFRQHGFPSETQKYVFLGDFVDRGYDSLDTLLLLLVYKLLHKDTFLLIRGNHEDVRVSSAYGFRDEIGLKYGVQLFDAFIPLFDAMPLAALVNGKILCLHGGISPHLSSLAQIEAIKRPLKPEEGTLEYDLLWSDPSPDVEEYGPSNRGASCFFGLAPLNKFCDENGLDLLVRAHQMMEDGYGYNFGEGTRLVTIFSAPDYMEKKNKGAYMIVKEDGSIELFSYQPLTGDEREEFEQSNFQEWVTNAV